MDECDETPAGSEDNYLQAFRMVETGEFVYCRD